jgi:hypothetical protein
MSDLTTHAALRVRERGGARRGDEIRHLDSLWAGGREAIAEDFRIFRFERREGHDYRVCVKGGQAFIIVRSKALGVYVTIWKRRK